MRKVAIIDLGSNTAKLVLFAYEPGRSYRLVDELRYVVRLGSDMGPDGRLDAAAYARGLGALRSFRSYCDASGVTEIAATATSAVRDATNGASFLRDAETRTGLVLQVLSGEEEARLGVSAVANSLPYDDALVLDVGGGSAQLSLMRSRRFVRGGSWPIGAVRTTDAFLASDPPRPREIEALVDHVRDQVGPFFADAPHGLPLVGIGGTVRSLAKIDMKANDYLVDFKHGYDLGREELDAIVADVTARTVSGRADVAGLAGDRADIIAAGAITVAEVARLAGAPSITVCGQGLREGIFYARLFRDEPVPLLPDVRTFHVRNLAERHGAPGRNDHVRTLALDLFDGVRTRSGLGVETRELLAAAALLHDVGETVSFRDHHKHGLHLVMSEPLPGFTHREQALVALLVRYQRKGTPDPSGLGSLLMPGDVELVAKLAGLLRLARHLDRPKANRVARLRLTHGTRRFRIGVVPADGADVRLEIDAARDAADLLARSYGVSVEVEEASDS